MYLPQPHTTSTSADRLAIKKTTMLIEACLQRYDSASKIYASSPDKGESLSAIIQHLERHTSRSNSPCTKKSIKPVLKELKDCYRVHVMAMFVDDE
jgi:hypothetical protein